LHARRTPICRAGTHAWRTLHAPPRAPVEGEDKLDFFVFLVF